MADKSVITNLSERIQRLIADHRRVTAICSELTLQCGALKAENRTQQERIRSLEAELARTQLAAGLTGVAPETKKARARVNRLMREVDKCIALLATPPQE